MSICIWARAFEALARRTPCLIYLAAVLRPGAPPLAAERRAQRTTPVVRGALGPCPGSSTSSGTVRDFVAAPRPRGRWATYCLDARGTVPPVAAPARRKNAPTSRAGVGGRAHERSVLTRRRRRRRGIPRRELQRPPSAQYVRCGLRRASRTRCPYALCCTRRTAAEPSYPAQRRPRSRRRRRRVRPTALQPRARRRRARPVAARDYTWCDLGLACTFCSSNTRYLGFVCG